MKITFIFIVVLGCLVLLFSCKSNKKKSENADAPFVELRTTGCFGFCPVFRLTFLNNRQVEYEGLHFCEQMGIRKFEITEAEWAELQRQVARAKVWQQPEKFESQVMDAPGAAITVFQKGKKHTTSGTVDRPAPLLELEALMKQLAENHGIRVLRGVDPNEPPPGSRAEVIVKLDDSLNAGNWITQFEELRLRLVRRIPPENMWVVAYDTTQIDEATLLDIFRNTEGVILAQPNRQARERD